MKTAAACSKCAPPSCATCAPFWTRAVFSKSKRRCCIRSPAARPFKTHHNALDVDMYLRIAPELYLKRLTVGGFERVYEINRNFRNEGVSTQHNPEFTMLELYQAYADYTDLMEMIETLFQGLADTLIGSRKFSYQGVEFDLSKKFARMTIEDIILANNAGLDPMSLRDAAYLRRVCDQMKIP